MNVELGRVKMPTAHTGYVPVDLTQETMNGHYTGVLERMRDKGLNTLVIYGDREHGANFAYLTGFETRFEESLLILHRDGRNFFVLGNENLKMAAYSFVHGEVIHAPVFSLPNQPMEPDVPFRDLMCAAGITDGTNIGCVGWKLFTSKCVNNDVMFDLPHFVVEAIRDINPNGKVVNACDIFLDPETGLRNIHNANEIAHYEANAGLASARVLEAMNSIAPGKTELEVAQCLNAMGQPISITTICATGERFTNAVVFPRNKAYQPGARFSLTLGLRGGSSSRAGYVAKIRDELPETDRDYVEAMVKPYYRALTTMYENFAVGQKAGDFYDAVDREMPKEVYGWTLNPGHYTDDAEWSASPVWKDSGIVFKSGMMFQTDIIPSVRGHAGVSAEDGVAIADAQLRKEIAETYPDTWRRIQDRRDYMIRELGINLGPDVLPLSDICGYLRPLVLNHEFAMKVSEK